MEPSTARAWSKSRGLFLGLPGPGPRSEGRHRGLNGKACLERPPSRLPGGGQLFQLLLCGLQTALWGFELSVSLCICGGTECLGRDLKS